MEDKMRKLGTKKNRKMFGPERAPKYWCPFQIFPLQGKLILLLLMETGAPHSPIVPPQMILRCRAVW